MKHLLSLLLVLPIVACAPVNQDNASDSNMSSLMSSETSSFEVVNVTITLQKETSEDELATIHTKAKLVFSGNVNQVIDLGDILGDLVYVDPAAYGPYAHMDSNIEAVLTTWWAGAGDEFILRRDMNSVHVDRISGDETGTCTEPERVATVPMNSSAYISLAGFGTPVAQSSLAFCHQ